MPNIIVRLDSNKEIKIKVPNKAAARAHAMAIAVEGVRATRTTDEGKWDLFVIPPHRIISIKVDNGGLEEEYPEIDKDPGLLELILDGVKDIKKTLNKPKPRVM